MTRRKQTGLIQRRGDAIARRRIYGSTCRAIRPEDAALRMADAAFGRAERSSGAAVTIHRIAAEAGAGLGGHAYVGDVQGPSEGQSR
jgi:hypothetical protein